MIRIPVTEVPPVPLPQMTLRSRQEHSTRDLVNARNYEHWQTDGRYGVYNRPDLNSQAPMFDQMPLTARTDDRSYMQSQTFVAGDAALGGNPYFQKYDVTQDPRNVSRELRGAVFETIEDRGLKESRRMLERQFTAAAMPQQLSREDTETRMRARDQLMPAMDDFRRMYPKVLNSGAVCESTDSKK